MPTSRHRGLAIALLPALCLGVIAILPSSASGQLPASLLNEETEVQSIRFRFLDTETFSEDRLREQIGLTERGGAYGLRRSFSFLPFLSEPEPHPFDPLSLQRDVARLRAFYRGAGFPDVQVRYEVSLDPGRNVVAVEFLILEGPPRKLASVTYSGPRGHPLEQALPPELVPGWRHFVEERERAFVGKRLGDLERAQLRDGPLRWLMDRGYPFPSGATGLEVDSTGYATRLTVQMEPGPRSRVAAVEMEGATSVGESVVLREIPLRPGDWYSASRVSEGRRRVLGLALFSLTVAEAIPVEEADSAVRVVYRVREGHLRNVSGFLGYTNVGGLAIGGQWEHRNFVGGARTLDIGVTAETGVGAVLTDLPDEYVRGSVSLHQPFVFVPDLAVVVSPFGEYRNDYRDRSWEAGLDASLVYHWAPLRAASLRYRLSYREVLEFRVGADGLPVAALLGSILDPELLTDRIVVSALTLSATFGSLDDPVNPRRGFVIQPNVEVTAPAGTPTNEYLKAEIWGSHYLPLGNRTRLATSLRVGRVFPFGRSIPSSDRDGLEEFLLLRDVALTAGGPTDVRGWASRLMGPKIPDVRVGTMGDTTVYSASRYLPLGGLARVSGAVELQFPVPGFGSGFRGHVFLDGGRVWTPDDRYLPQHDPLDQDRPYFSTGAGVGIETPVGPIRLSAGYKLNPSPLDLRDPGDVLDLLVAGRSILEAPTRNERRLQLHLTVGRAF